MATKAKAEHELQALALQLETAVARARECEENQRAAEDVASQHKVSHAITCLLRLSDIQRIVTTFFSQAAASEAARKLVDVERERDAARHR